MLRSQELLGLYTAWRIDSERAENCQCSNDKPMMIGLTYSAHAVACAAALEMIKYEDANW
ncbi:MAG: hypothetical protein IPP29_13055 [Bacteroidetes bacterium]|nr:hypothetical protein [Bacteroidota bacterium]